MRLFAVLFSFYLALSPHLMGQIEPSEVWEPFQFLVGTWKGRETGRAGKGRGERTYQFILGEQYLFADNVSRFDPQQENQKGEVHKDWTFFSYDRNRETFVVRQFNIEGFVNRFVMDAEESDSQTFVFISEASENAPPGLRARLTFLVQSPRQFTETFELAMPGEDYQLMLKNVWKKELENGGGKF